MEGRGSEENTVIHTLKENNTSQSLQDKKTNLVISTKNPSHPELLLSLKKTKVIIHLQMWINLGDPELQAVMFRAAGILQKEIGGEDKADAVSLLQSCKQKYMTISEEDNQEYSSRLKRIIGSLSKTEKTFVNIDLKSNRAVMDAFSPVQRGLSWAAETLYQTLSAQSIESMIATSPRMGSDSDIPIATNYGEMTPAEEKALINCYMTPLALVSQDMEDPLGYAALQNMFNPLDSAIYKMMLNNQEVIVKDLLKYRTLLVAYLLKNIKNENEKQRIKKLSWAAGELIHGLIPNEERLSGLTADEINSSVNSYYSEFITSGLALHADSLSNEIIKSIAAIVVGVVVFAAFSALVVGLVWVICHAWAPAVLVGLSLKIHADLVGLSLIATGLAAICGFFSHHYLRGKGCLDSEIAQSSMTFTTDLKEAKLPGKPLFK